MKLVDFDLSENDLIRDDLYNAVLPNNIASFILGQYGKSRSNKYYFVKCLICANDPDMFGDGVFRIMKTNLMAGKIPCGCSSRYIKNEDQVKLVVLRALEKTGQNFKSWSGNFKGSNSKCILECSEHGEYVSSRVSTFARLGSGCIKCAVESIKISDEDYSEKFMSTGAFPEGTTFWRSDNKNSSGWKTNFFVNCSRCGEIHERGSSSLTLGKVPCSCGPNKQNFAYINSVVDNGIPIAIKFGISAKPIVRTVIQNKTSIFDIESIGFWKFESTDSCRRAETECLRNFDTGVISKDEMPDGWTETTHVYNLDKIIKIYETYGGVHGT